MKALLSKLALATTALIVIVGPPTKWAPHPRITDKLPAFPIGPALTADLDSFQPSTAGRYEFSWSVKFAGTAGDHPVWVDVQRDLSDIALVNGTLSSKGTATLTGSVVVRLPDAAHPSSPWRFHVALIVGTYGQHAAMGGVNGSTFSMTYLGP